MPAQVILNGVLIHNVEVPKGYVLTYEYKGRKWEISNGKALRVNDIDPDRNAYSDMPGMFDWVGDLVDDVKSLNPFR
jgi:hypothetical protein